MTQEKEGGVSYAPASQPHTLASGRPVTFEQPDIYGIAKSSGEVTNIVAADLFQLIYRGRRETDPAQLLLNDQQHTQKLFHVLQVIMRPRLKLDDDDPEGIVGRREVNFADLGAGYNFLLFGPERIKVAAIPQPSPGKGAPADETGT